MGAILGGQQPAATPDRLAAAHAALRGDPTIQFAFTPSPPPPQAPAWLRALGRMVADALRPIGRALRWLASELPDAPYARILLWGMLAVIAAGIGWMVVERIRTGVWRLPARRRHALADAPAEEEWRPNLAPARAWLDEADRLADAGRYTEAIHYLLFRSVEDIARRRPALNRPALTSRELAATALLPEPVRRLFADIAALVERSVFGGCAVAGEEWQAARAAYAQLALPKAWRG